jgi:DNA-3-methyladenine glycosylase I
VPVVEKTRCGWARSDEPLYIRYHDREWGVPVHDDRRLFEFLLLEGAQAGLSWITILRKRDAYRRAFAEFDAEKVARFGKRDIARLLRDEGIVRNRLKIEAAIQNAKSFLEVCESEDSFDKFLWLAIDHKPIQNHWKKLADVPAETRESRALSHELKKLGFRFVGPTICYAFMQAVGMVNDHAVTCFLYKELARSGSRR